MARCSGFLGLVMFFIYLLPPPLLAARLELRQLSTASTEIAVEVGDQFEVELWIDSESQPLSGAAIFLSFDEEIFELVAQDRDPAIPDFQPFAPGPFLHNGEIYRNALLAEDDPAASAAGAQVDYSVVRAIDQGRGAIASFRLRARAPSAHSTIRIDESGIRETRFFTPDGSHQPFRFIAPLQVKVRGIELDRVPSRLVLARGQVDSTTFRLDEFISDPLYGPQDIQWTISPSAALGLDYDPLTRLVRLQAPEGSSPWEQVRLTATNPDGQSAIATVEVFVNAPPVLAETIPPVEFAEDQSYSLAVEELARDPDATPASLQWRLEAPPPLGAALVGPPYAIRFAPQLNWNGAGQFALRVTDEFGFADTAQVEFAVSPVDDPPQVRMAPNIRLIRGRQDSSLTRGALLSDPEESVDQLRLSWEGAGHVGIAEQDGRLLLSAPLDWTGVEQIQLRVADSEGLSATAPLTVTVVQSLPPALLDPPRRRGIAPGSHFVLDLDSLVQDPDDERPHLSWRISGQQQLRVQLSTSRAARIEAPAGFAGTELLNFSVTDPSGETARFDLLVFAAAADGAPAIAPLPEIRVPLAGVDTSLDLDDYLYDLDHGPAQMEWSVQATGGVELRIDPDTHVLVIAPTAAAQAGPLQVELRVRDPDGHEAFQSLLLDLIGPQEVPPVATPVLAPLPGLSIRAGQFDQSLDLDEFISDADPGALTWEVEDQEHLRGIVDPQSHRLLVLVDEGWSGQGTLLLRARDGLGHALEGVLQVEVLPAEPALALPGEIRAALFAGESEIRLPAAALGQAPPAGLSWEAWQDGQPLEVAYDSQAEVLILKSAFPWEQDETLSLRARDGQGRQATARILVRVYPADGSAGQEIPEFRLAIVPNPFQPEYLELFVLSDRPLSRPPRLRLQGEQDLETASSAPGIWQGSHVLPPGAQGAFEFLGLGVDQDQNLLKSHLAFTPPHR